MSDRIVPNPDPSLRRDGSSGNPDPSRRETPARTERYVRAGLLRMTVQAGYKEQIARARARSAPSF